MILKLITFIIVFGILVFVHELGHFLAARASKVKVHEFAIGMGPILIARNGASTKYSLRALPLGGFVRLEGEDSESDDPDSLAKRSPLQKIFVFAAGPLMNFGLAIVLLTAVFSFYGVPTEKSVVGEVIKGYPAAASGIISGDRVVSVNGENVSTWISMTQKIKSSKGDVMLVIDRNGKTFDITIKPVKESSGEFKIGVLPYVEKSVGNAFVYSAKYTWKMTVGILTFIANIPFAGVQDGSVVGPVGMFQIVGNAAESGFSDVIYLMAVLSVNLGIFNLLPFPALDGGRIVFAVIEKLRGRPVDPQKEGIFHLVGFALLLLLMVVLILNDTGSLLNKGK